MMKIENDMLVRMVPVNDKSSDCIIYRGECVITKEEFLACFNEWVEVKKDD